MAARLDAQADTLSRVTSLPTAGSVTICGWVKPYVYSTNSLLLVLSNTAETDFILYDLSSETSNLAIVWSGSVNEIIASNPTDWFFWALVWGSAGSCTGYYGAIGSALQSVGATGTTFTIDKMYMGYDVAGNGLNAAISAVKIWDAALTLDELEKERHQYLPNRLANLHLFSPFIATGGTSFLDISGNGRNWTEAGTVVDEDGPPIPWKMGRHRILIPAVVIEGSTCWGHSTGVTQDNTRTFSGNWTGTGTIENSGDTERIRLAAGEYMESEVVNTGAVQTTITLNSYAAGDSVTVKYRTGADRAACEAASWSTYSAPFSSSGFAQVRLEA